MRLSCRAGLKKLNEMIGDFKEKTKRILSKRAGEKCSICGIGTCKPHSDEKSFVNLGEAAHIKGNKEGIYNRYDESMTDDERNDISNGIWLCNTCHKTIDSDDKSYTVDRLHVIKKEHENKVAEGYYNKQFPDFNSEKMIMHDQLIFKESESIFKESELDEFLAKLSKNSFLYIADENFVKLNNLIEFHNLQGKRFMQEEINNSYSNFRYSINVLLLQLYSVKEKDKKLLNEDYVGAFMPKRFFIGMQPFSNTITNILIPIEEKIKFENSFHQFSKSLFVQIQRVKNAYTEYRQTIKRLLFT